MYLGLLKKYQYDNAPEGKDPLGKFISVTKAGLIVGITGGTWRACLYHANADHRKIIQVMSKAIIPCTGMAAAFTTTVFLATDIRKKDDEWNYICGAMAATGVFYSCTGFKTPSIQMLLLGSFLAAAYKSFTLHGIYFTQKPTQTQRLF